MFLPLSGVRRIACTVQTKYLQTHTGVCPCHAGVCPCHAGECPCVLHYTVDMISPGVHLGSFVLTWVHFWPLEAWPEEGVVRGECCSSPIRNSIIR